MMLLLLLLSSRWVATEYAMPGEMPRLSFGSQPEIDTSEPPNSSRPPPIMELERWGMSHQPPRPEPKPGSEAAHDDIVPRLRLWSNDTCPFAQSVRIALHELNLLGQAEVRLYEHINLYTTDFVLFLPTQIDAG